MSVLIRIVVVWLEGVPKKWVQALARVPRTKVKVRLSEGYRLWVDVCVCACVFS